MWLELLVVIICGAGTFLLRALPIWRVRRRAARATHITYAQHAARHGNNRVQRFFAGIGPAALTALLLVSVWPFFRDSGHTPRQVCAAVSLIVLYVGKRLTRGLAGPTLVSAAVYGVLMHALTE